MIQEVDDVLRALVRRELTSSDVEIAFEAPTRDWAARRNSPTVDVYLYDVREDQQRREIAWERVHGDDGRVVAREAPPRRFKLSYLITAWTQRPEDEHRLLSGLLACFLKYDAVPRDLLVGSLLQTSLPVLLLIAQPPPQDRSLSDVWSALGGELKPSLDLIVTAPFVQGKVEEAGPPVREQPRLSVRGPLPGANADAVTARAGRAAPEADETLASGSPQAPGRVVRVKTFDPKRPVR